MCKEASRCRDQACSGACVKNKSLTTRMIQLLPNLKNRIGKNEFIWNGIDRFFQRRLGLKRIIPHSSIQFRTRMRNANQWSSSMIRRLAQLLTQKRKLESSSWLKLQVWLHPNWLKMNTMTMMLDGKFLIYHLFIYIYIL